VRVFPWFFTANALRAAAVIAANAKAAVSSRLMFGLAGISSMVRVSLPEKGFFQFFCQGFLAKFSVVLQCFRRTLRFGGKVL
jgi:hypothetical protein